MSSHLKKASLAKEAPMPRALQKVESARAKAAPGASAKPKTRPRSKSPSAQAAVGRNADLRSRFLEQAKTYTATVNRIFPTSSSCSDLGRGVMSYRQALDKRQPMKLACFEPDRMHKIGLDDEGKGTAYTATGESYERILKRLADLKIDPVVPISE